MILLTTDESHYIKYQNGYYDPANYRVGNYFDNVLAVFDKIIFVARCREVSQKPDCMRVDNDRIVFYPISDFSGYTGYILQAIALWECRKVVGLADRYWLQGPGFVASMVAFWLKRKQYPYYVHIIGDPENVAKALTSNWPAFLSSLISTHYKKKFQEFVHYSHGAMSVTERYLRQKYPSGMPQNDLGVSDVRLPEELFVNPKRNYNAEILELIIVGALLKYKGHMILLKALSKIKFQRSWRLNIIGNGPERLRLEKQAKSLGISENVVFHGRMDPKEVFERLEKADLFILSSLTEGMPRVLLEAMAKGLPVIATDVGGVSEILPSNVIVKPGDVNALAERISEIWNNPDMLKQMSQVNYDRIQDFKLIRLSRLRRNWLQWMRDYECKINL
jgi:glycosyltransferase involved in cell wall biosynthesis